jgi:hypothetical protein
VSNFAFQVTGAFQGDGEFAFQGASGVVVVIPPVVGGSGKSSKRRNEILEIEGKRWVVPKEQVAEFLAQFEKKDTQVVEIQTVRTQPGLQTVSFTTPTGKVIKTTADVLKDDIGVILVMCALADEDFYE